MAEEVKIIATWKNGYDDTILKFTAQWKESSDKEVPLAPGKSASCALLNLFVMNLAILESLILLIGYFVKRKNDDEEKRKRKEKEPFIALSLLIAAISLIVFILTEDITLPKTFVDKYTIVMPIIAVGQTVVAVLSYKKLEALEKQSA